MNIPKIEIIDNNPNVSNVQNMKEINSNEWAGRFCVRAIITDPGDFVPEKNKPFEWTVLVGGKILATGNTVLIEKQWIGNFKIHDADKFETGTEFSPENTDGSAMKIGGRFRNLNDFEITIRVEKRFSDKYWIIYEKTYSGISYHKIEEWGEILNTSEMKLVDHNFPAEETEEDTKPDTIPEEDTEQEGNMTEEKTDGLFKTFFKGLWAKIKAFLKSIMWYVILFFLGFILGKFF